MANLQHSTLPSASVHEPKHITSAGTSSSGKVITSSSSAAGVSEYRFLKAEDITELQETLMILEIDASVAQTHYIPMMYQGDIVAWSATPNSAITTSTNSYELQIDGVSVTGSAMSLTVTPGSGGTAGDIITAYPTTALSFTAGQTLTVVNTALGNTDAGVDIRFAILIERT